jgi:hypothetical protein
MHFTPRRALQLEFIRASKAVSRTFGKCKDGADVGLIVRQTGNRRREEAPDEWPFQKTLIG